MSSMRIRFAALALALVLTGVGTASAQNWSGFSYYNPRTGRGYSSGATWGNGHYSSGFSYTRPGRSGGAYGGFNGRSYHGGQFNSSRARYHSQDWRYGR